MPKKTHSKRNLLIIFVILLIVITAIFWLMSRKNSQFVANNPATTTSTQNASVTQNNVNALTTGSGQVSSISQADTQVDCQIKIGFRDNLVVNEQTRDCYEYFITQLGEKQLAAIEQDFKNYIFKTYPKPANAEIIDLWSRYLKYREALGKLSIPASNNIDSQYYQNILTATKALQEKFFSKDEIKGLFGDEDVYNDYTVKRMQVLQDASLSASEKATKLKALLEDLPKNWQEQIKQQSVLQDLHKLTADLKAQHASPEQIQDMRINLVGQEAADRLNTLDKTRAEWQTRVNQYLTERDEILRSNSSNESKQQSIQQLQQQQFQDPKERIRLKAFETTHDQGSNALLN